MPCICIAIASSGSQVGKHKMFFGAICCVHVPSLSGTQDTISSLAPRPANSDADRVEVVLLNAAWTSSCHYNMGRL